MNLTNCLLAKIKMGCNKSKQQLVMKYLHITKRVSSHYKGVPIPIEDLEQEGVVGLYQAIEAFDQSKDCSFETYATSRVFTVIDEYVLRNKHVHSIPLYMLKKMRSAKKRKDNDRDERHYDKGVEHMYYEVNSISIDSAPDVVDDDPESTHLPPGVLTSLTNHEGGRYLIDNKLYGESIQDIAHKHGVEPYLIKKKIKECLGELVI